MGTESITIFDTVQLSDTSFKLIPNKFRIPDFIVTKKFLENYRSNVIFVFGDNLIHRGKGGAAVLRDEENAVGFITKKYPNNNISSFFTPQEYLQVFHKEVDKIQTLIEKYPNILFLFSKLGSGLANKYCIFEEIIEPWLLSLKKYPNCVLLF